MAVLLRLFGWPHELLHVLALRLIGRRPRAVTQAHVDIPTDLTTRQFIFVAGLPALVFGVAMAISVGVLLNAQTVIELGLGLVFTALFSLATLGTAGDLHLIVLRLLEDQQKGFK